MMPMRVPAGLRCLSMRTMFKRAFAVWCLIFALEVVHGVLRTMWLVPLVGAALAVWHRYLGHPRIPAEGKDSQRGSYLGPAFSDETIESFLREGNNILPRRFRTEHVRRRQDQAAPLAERSDRSLRRLEALLLVADAGHTFVISGNGDVIEPEHDLIAVGSGGPFAQAAGLALLQNTTLDARSIAERALGIAADICIYTNRNTTIEEL